MEADVLNNTSLLASLQCSDIQQVEQYVQARESAEAALVEQKTVSDALKAECETAKRDASAAKERALRSEEKATDAESLINELQTKLKSATLQSTSRHSDAPLFDGDFGPPSPLFSPTPSSVRHLEMNPALMDEQNNGGFGQLRGSGSISTQEDRENISKQNETGDEDSNMLRLQNERLVQALSVMRKDVERLRATSTAGATKGRDMNATSENILGAQVVALQQQVSLLFEQVKQKNSEDTSTPSQGGREVLSDVHHTGNHIHQMTTMQHELERAKRKLKRAAADREKLTEISNKLKSKLKHLSDKDKQQCELNL
jgi:hypothetical protein